MLYDMMHPEDRERSRGVMVRALKGELEEYVDEFRVQPVPASEMAGCAGARGRAPMQRAARCRVSGTIADIDSRKRAETRIAGCRARYARWSTWLQRGDGASAGVDRVRRIPPRARLPSRPSRRRG